MRLLTYFVQRNIFIVLLNFVFIFHGKEDSSFAESSLSAPDTNFSSLDFSDIDRDISHEDAISDQTPEGSKDRLSYVTPPKQLGPNYKIKVQNVTKEDYEILQWYSTPTEIKRDAKRAKESKFGDKKDLFAQSSSHSEGYNSPYKSDYYSGSSDYSPEKFSSAHDHGESDKFHETHYKKPRRKVRKPCLKSKNKKTESYQDGSDTTIVHSRSKDGVEVSHYNSNVPGSLGAVPHVNYGNLIKLAKSSQNQSPLSYSGEHLHGIPRFNTMAHMHKDEGNHFHLHNHHHHYGADGKKIDPTGRVNSYMSLLSGIGNLRNMLSGATGGTPLGQSFNLGNLNNVLPGVGNGGINSNQPNTESFQSEINGLNTGEKAPYQPVKKGYHYTGPYKSYGRKTYRRIKDNNQSTNSDTSSDIDDMNIGDGMYKYGVGPFGTDEYRDSDGKYPNEVSLPGDIPHPHDGSSISDGYGDPHGKDGHSSLNYDHDPRGPHPEHQDYPDDSYAPSYDHGPTDDRYPPHSSPYASHEVNDPNSFDSGRVSSHSSGDPPGPLNSHEAYDHSPHHENDAHHHPPGHEPNSPVGIPHSVSYSSNSEPEELPYDPAKEHLYKNMRPEPDPFTIPKNARVIEHHIRLHPMHFTMYQQPFVDIQSGGSYPVPVHKLIPNPLKAPTPYIPRPPMYPSHQLNQVLHAYQSRSLYHKWWAPPPPGFRHSG